MAYPWSGNSRIVMENIERQLLLPYRMSRVSLSYGMHQAMSVTLPDCLGLCLRLEGLRKDYAQELDGERFTNAFPHVVVKRPGARLTQFGDSPRHRVAEFVFASGDMDFFRRTGLLSPPLIWDYTPTEDIRETLRALYRWSARLFEPGAASQMDVLGLRLWSLLDVQKRHARMDENSVEGRMRRIASHLQVHYRENLDYARLAAEHGFSRRSFFRHWRRLFSGAPHQTVLELKLEEARWLLARGHAPEDVCRRTNIRPKNYLMRLLRRPRSEKTR